MAIQVHFRSIVIAESISKPDVKPGILLVAGLLLLMFSMAFKVSAAPFHFWTPDVYDGAPTVFTSFMATIVKAAVFIAFIRLFYHAFGDIHDTWKFIIAVITALTLFIGNITAVFQQSVKRMLAYSSIAQAGFMLMAILALNSIGSEGILLYTTAYCLSTIGLFAILVKMKDYTFEGFNGFAKHQPLLGSCCSYFSFIISRHSINCRISCKILYDQCSDQQRRFSVACDSCSINGCNQCLLLFPCDTGNVF